VVGGGDEAVLNLDAMFNLDSDAEHDPDQGMVSEPTSPDRLIPLLARETYLCCLTPLPPPAP
jgi:hypothetical protein